VTLKITRTSKVVRSPDALLTVATPLPCGGELGAVAEVVEKGKLTSVGAATGGVLGQYSGPLGHPTI
jgi:hypothetical protein